MKRTKPLESREDYIKHYIGAKPLSGRWLVLLGGIALLAFAASELYIRYDAADGILEAYFKLVKDGDISLYRALQNLLSVDEVRRDLTVLLYLAGTALYGFYVCLAHRSRRLFSQVIAGIAVFFISSGISSFGSYSIMRLGGCISILAGCCLKFISIQKRRIIADRKYTRLAAKRRRPSTLIPARIHEKRK